MSYTTRNKPTNISSSRNKPSGSSSSRNIPSNSSSMRHDCSYNPTWDDLDEPWNNIDRSWGSFYNCPIITSRNKPNNTYNTR